MGFEAYTNARDNVLANGERRRAERQQQAQMQARQQAGNALMGGDYAGGAQALYGAGDLSGGMAIQGAGQRQEAASREERVATLAAGATGLLYVPQEQRGQVFMTQIAPMLQAAGMDPAMIQQLSQAPMDDASLKAFVASLGGEVQGNQTFNTRQGVVERDPYSQSYSMGYAVEPQPRDAPAGYRWTADNNLEPIPGGPADPRTVQARAAAGRAPPRPRSSGGLSTLPPGFTIRRR